VVVVCGARQREVELTKHPKMAVGVVRGSEKDVDKGKEVLLAENMTLLCAMHARMLAAWLPGLPPVLDPHFGASSWPGLVKRNIEAGR
jgi:hypothetical protein